MNLASPKANNTSKQTPISSNQAFVQKMRKISKEGKMSGLFDMLHKVNTPTNANVQQGKSNNTSHQLERSQIALEKRDGIHDDGFDEDEDQEVDGLCFDEGEDQGGPSYKTTQRRLNEVPANQQQDPSPGLKAMMKEGVANPTDISQLNIDPEKLQVLMNDPDLT